MEHTDKLFGLDGGGGGKKMSCSNGVFGDVHYYVCEENIKNLTEVKQILREGGASREFYYSELVTHIISNGPISTSNEGVPEDCNKQIVVHSDWARMSVKCGAQLPFERLAPFQVYVEKLFSGLTFCPSKLSSSDVEKLCILVLYYGGKMQRRLDSKVTHLVTVETKGSKYDLAMKHSEIQIVTSHWVQDCVESNQLMATEKYHPSFLKSSPSPSQACNGASPSVPTSSILSKPVSIVSSPLAAEVLASRPELNEDFHSRRKSASRYGKGPVQRASLTSHEAEEQAGETGSKIVTEERTAERKGGAFLPPEGSAPSSEKLLEGIGVCFIDYQECVEDDTLEKWKLVVEQHGGQVLDKYDPHHCTHLLSLHKKSDIFSQALKDSKCIASAHWLNDVLTDQRMFPPRNPIHFPTAFKWQLPGAEQFSMTLTSYTDTERELVKDMLRICGIAYTGHLTRNNTHLICKKPEGKKYEMALEWGVQIVNSKFLAHIIHEGEAPPILSATYTTLNQPDEFSSLFSQKAALLLETWGSFLKQYAQCHSTALLTSGSLHAPESSQTSDSTRKRRRSARLDHSMEDQDLARKSGRTVPVVLFTGVGVSLVKKLKQVVTRLGGVVTDSGKECTHLVTLRITRTVKFLSAISVCTYVLTPDWAEECSRQKKFVSEDPFVLQDTDTEQLFGMKLAHSLLRARHKRLLGGMCVCPTQAVQPPFASMTEIVECAGGELLTVEEAQARFLSEGGDPAGKQLVVLSSPADIEAGHCKEFIAKNVTICNAELILTGVLNQTLNFEMYTFVIDHA